MRNALAYAGKTQRHIVSAWISTAFAQDAAAAAARSGARFADQARANVPKLAALMEEAEADVSHMNSLVPRRAKLHSTNPLEWLNGDINRRSDVVGTFPDK